MSVTLKDVALAAKVDPSTVSLAISNSRKIPEATKQRIIKIAKEMNYRPHLSARSLATGKTNTIAVVTLLFNSFYTMGVLSGIENNDDYLNYNVSYHSTKADKTIESGILNEIIRSNKADVVIGLMLSPDPSVLEEFKLRNIVYISVSEPAPGFYSVLTDDYTGGCLAAEKLIQNGLKKPALISGKSAPGFVNYSIFQRAKGFTDTLRQHGITLDSGRIFTVERYQYEEGVKIMQAISRDLSNIDSVFSAAGDLTAIGVITEAQKLGINVPDDLAVIGFDDIVNAQTMRPGLTTVQQPLEEIGKTAFDIAVKALRGEHPERHEYFYMPKMVIRESA